VRRSTRRNAERRSARSSVTLCMVFLARQGRGHRGQPGSAHVVSPDTPTALAETHIRRSAAHNRRFVLISTVQSCREFRGRALTKRATPGMPGGRDDPPAPRHTTWNLQDTAAKACVRARASPALARRRTDSRSRAFGHTRGGTAAAPGSRALRSRP
jgi:hypothetical protein